MEGGESALGREYEKFKGAGTIEIIVVPEDLTGGLDYGLMQSAHEHFAGRGALVQLVTDRANDVPRLHVGTAIQTIHVAEYALRDEGLPFENKEMVIKGVAQNQAKFERHIETGYLRTLTIFTEIDL